MTDAHKVKILYGEADSKVATEQATVFTKAGYHVEQVIGRSNIEKSLEGATFGLVILGHTLSKDDRHHLPYIAKRNNSETRVLVLHASGKHPKVDVAVDSRRGAAVVLEAIAGLLLQPAAAA